jgi:hypothetical protein
MYNILLGRSKKFQINNAQSTYKVHYLGNVLTTLLQCGSKNYNYNKSLKNNKENDSPLTHYKSSSSIENTINHYDSIDNNNNNNNRNRNRNRTDINEYSTLQTNYNSLTVTPTSNKIEFKERIKNNNNEEEEEEEIEDEDYLVLSDSETNSSSNISHHDQEQEEADQEIDRMIESIYEDIDSQNSYNIDNQSDNNDNNDSNSNHNNDSNNSSTPFKLQHNLDRPVKILWKNHLEHKGQAGLKMRMTLTQGKPYNNKINSLKNLNFFNNKKGGLRVDTRDHGLTEYYGHRIHFIQAHAIHPKLFVWVYQHVGKNLKSEIRCHAAMCQSVSDASDIAHLLTDKVQRTFLEYKREKRRQQNSRLCHMKYGSLLPNGGKKRMQQTTLNYKPPVQKGMFSAPKLDDVLEEEEEEEEQAEEEEIIEIGIDIPTDMKTTLEYSKINDKLQPSTDNITTSTTTTSSPSLSCSNNSTSSTTSNNSFVTMNDESLLPPTSSSSNQNSTPKNMIFNRNIDNRSSLGLFEKRLTNFEQQQGRPSSHRFLKKTSLGVDLLPTLLHNHSNQNRNDSIDNNTTTTTTDTKSLTVDRLEIDDNKRMRSFTEVSYDFLSDLSETANNNNQISKSYQDLNGDSTSFNYFKSIFKTGHSKSFNKSKHSSKQSLNSDIKSNHLDTTPKSHPPPPRFRRQTIQSEFENENNNNDDSTYYTNSNFLTPFKRNQISKSFSTFTSRFRSTTTTSNRKNIETSEPRAINHFLNDKNDEDHIDHYGSSAFYSILNETSTTSASSTNSNVNNNKNNQIEQTNDDKMMNFRDDSKDLATHLSSSSSFPSLLSSTTTSSTTTASSPNSSLSNSPNFNNNRMSTQI